MVNPLDLRRAHHVAAKYKWATVVLAPVLIALLLWAATEVVNNHLAGKGEPNIWMTGFVLVVLGVLILVFIASIVWAFRGRIVLDGDSMKVRGVFGSQVVTIEQIEGYRWINRQLHLYLKNREWPIKLAYYEDQYAINAWVFQRAEDEAARELAEEDTAIARDVSLGPTEARKEAQLAGLRKAVKRINVLAYSAAVVGAANVLILKQDVIAKAAAAVLVSIPIVLDVLALRNHGHIRVDHQEGTRYAQIFSGTMACGVGLALMSLFDESTLIGNEFYVWFAFLALAKGLLWVYIDVHRLRMLRARSQFASTVTAILLLLLPAFWVGGGVYQVNQHLDASSVTWNATEVVSKKKSSGRRVTTYNVTVKPWGPSMEQPLELAVSRDEFDEISAGMQLEVGVRRGALRIPWVAEVRIVAEKSD